MFDFFFTSTVCPRNIVYLYIVGTLLNLDKTSWTYTRYIYFSETIICRVAYSGSDLPDPISDPVLTLARNGSDPDPVRFYHFFGSRSGYDPAKKNHGSRSEFDFLSAPDPQPWFFGPYINNVL